MAARAKIIHLPWQTFTSTSTTAYFVGASRWMNTAGVSMAMSWCEVTDLTGSLLLIPAYQLTNDTRAAGTTGNQVTMSGGASGWANATGYFDPSTSPNSIGSTGYKYIRVGWLVKLSAGSTRAYAAAAGAVELQWT